MGSDQVKGSPNGATKCFEFGHRNNRGEPCGANVIKGTTGCRRHAGKRPEKAKAEGAVVTELRRWGLTSQVDLVDPGQTLLKLVTQSASRADFLAGLLGDAYDAAERLAAAERVPDGGDLLSAESARLDLERVLNHGGVAALIGNTYAADKQAGIFATGEAIRGLQALENAERERCAGFAATAVKAGLAERMVRLAEQQGAMLATILVGALEDLGVHPGEERVRQVLGARIAAATGTPLVLEGRAA
jgi:hypothetical protein